MELPKEAVDAAIKVLSEELELNNYARVVSYIWEGQTPSEREDGLRRLKAADEAAETKSFKLVEKAIMAAIEKLPGKCSGCGELVNGVYCGYCLE